MADHTVTTDGEWATLFANSDSFFDNKTVAVSGSSITARSLSSRTFTNLTLESADASSTLPKLDLDGVTGMTLDGLNFRNDNSGGSTFTAADSFYMLVVIGSSSVAVTNCTFNADCTTGEKDQRFGGIRITGSACPITDSTFTSTRDGVVANSCHTSAGNTATITGCDFTDTYEDAITGMDSDWVVNDNTATNFTGDYGRRFTGTVSGSISVGELLTDGGSGDAEKVLKVVATDGSTYVDGYYNKWAKPGASDVLTGASGSVTVSGETVDFDGIHGNFFQPLMNAATANRSIECLRNFVYRTNAYQFDALQNEQNVEGVLAQLNGSSYNWSTVNFRYNVICGGAAEGIVIEGALGGTVYNNTVAWAEYGLPCDILIFDSDGVTLGYNAGDNNSGGVIDDDGGNTNQTLTNNVFVDGDSGAQELVYADPFTYPQTLAGFAPVAGKAVAAGDAGALTVAGAFRTEIGSITVPGPTIVEASPTFAASTASDTLSLGTFTAGAGSNRKVIAVLGHFDAGQVPSSATASWGGVAGELVESVNSGIGFEFTYVFQWREENFPSGATGTLSFTANAAADNMAGTAFTVKDANQTAAASVTAVSAAANTVDITPSSDDSLVIGVMHESSGTTGTAWTAGLSLFGAHYVYGGTGGIGIGTATQDAASLTCTHNTASGRPSTIAIALAPAPAPAELLPGTPTENATGAYAVAGTSVVYLTYDEPVAYSGSAPHGAFSVTNGTGSAETILGVTVNGSTVAVAFGGDTPQFGDATWTITLDNSGNVLTTVSTGDSVADFTDLAVGVTAANDRTSRPRDRSRRR